jgi:hypothetical protein
VSASNVVPIAGESSTPAPSLPMPVHFKRVGLKQAWNDLVTSAGAGLLVPENRFTFEIAATLLAKFRAGKPMTATESKDLKRYMITLGLARADDDQGAPKKRKLDTYRR